MVMLGIAIIFGLIFCVVAVRANSRFRDQDLLPMQWWLTGEVTWSAPRVIALALIPALALGVLTINAALALNLRPRPGQEYLELAKFIATGVTFIAIQLLHLWLIQKALRRNSS